MAYITRFITILIASLVILALSTTNVVWGSPINPLKRLEKRGEDSGVGKLVDGALGTNALTSGKATFFNPENPAEGGSEGACGKSESSTTRIVAVNSKQYKSNICGRKVLITHGEKETIAEVRDECPTCEKGSLDLTKIVFEDLGDLITGVLDIVWCFLDEPGCKPKHLKYNKGGDKKKEKEDKKDERT